MEAKGKYTFIRPTKTSSVKNAKVKGTKINAKHVSAKGPYHKLVNSKCIFPKVLQMKLFLENKVQEVME